MTKLRTNGMKKVQADHIKHSPNTVPCLLQGPKAGILARLLELNNHVEHFQQILDHFLKISNLGNGKKFLCHKLFTVTIKLMYFNSVEAMVLLEVWTNLQKKFPLSIAAHTVDQVLIFQDWC